MKTLLTIAASASLALANGNGTHKSYVDSKPQTQKQPQEQNFVLPYEEDLRKPKLNSLLQPSCEENELEWTYNYPGFLYVAKECGFDYVKLRYDRAYKSGDVMGKVTYFFSLIGSTPKLDSLDATFKKNNAEIKIKINDKQPVLETMLKELDKTFMFGRTKREKYKNLVEDLRKKLPPKKQKPISLMGHFELPKKFVAKRNHTKDYENFARFVHDSFRSGLNYDESENKATLDFQILRKRYTIENILDEGEVEKSIIGEVFQKECIGAYSIGVFNKEEIEESLKFGQARSLRKKYPWMENPLNLFALMLNKTEDSVEITVAAEYNSNASYRGKIKYLGIRINNMFRDTLVECQERASYKMKLPWKGQNVVIEAYATSTDGERVVRNRPSRVLLEGKVVRAKKSKYVLRIPFFPRAINLF